LTLAAALDEHFPLLVQGRRPKAQMLEEFRRGGNGVLIGTKSFWEGVDVPGMALRLVIIDRLPFPVPTDPLWSARKERVEAEGGNAFTELHLPHAMLTLKQGFGRLLRREDDVGIVAVLDKRLVTRGYGKKLLAGLPPASRTASLAEVEVFARSRIWPRLEQLADPPAAE
ncbi:MAG: ATP-dependent DNA helicase, partial [Proteobacteria bacterium]